MSVSDNAVALLGETGLVDETRLSLVEEHTDGVRTVAAEAADFVNESLERQALRLATKATDFRGWSQRYLRRLVAADALAGVAAVIAAAAMPRGVHHNVLPGPTIMLPVGLVTCLAIPRQQ